MTDLAKDPRGADGCVCVCVCECEEQKARHRIEGW